MASSSFNPCFCGCSLKTGTIIIAVMQMIFGMISGIVLLVLSGLTIGGLVAAANARAEQAKIYEKHDEGHAGLDTTFGAALGLILAFQIIGLLISAGFIYLGWSLKRGAEQDDYRKCRTWLIVCAILFIISIISIPFNWQLGLLGLPLRLYELFTMWVVYEFMKTIKTKNEADEPEEKIPNLP